MGSMFNDPNKYNPGPGKYISHSRMEARKGFYLDSRHKSPGITVMSNSKKRFDNVEERE